VVGSITPRQDLDELNLSWINLHFVSTEVEASWQRERLNLWRRSTRVAVLSLVVVNSLFYLLDLMFIHSPQWVLWTRLSMVATSLITWAIAGRVRDIAKADALMLVFLLISSLFQWPVIFLSLPEAIVRTYWLPGGMLIIGASFILFEFPLRTRFMGAVFLFMLSVLTGFYWGSRRELGFGFFYFGGVFLFGWVGAWQAEFNRRVAFREQRAVERERRRADALLHNILPTSIANRLLSDTSTIAQRHESITVLFADIVGFTPMSATMSAEHLVERLDLIFTRFDALCVHHGLEKIKTIGDAYMVAGGVPEHQADHAVRVVAMGLDMLESIAQTATELDVELRLRIGINSGPAVAGVIGARKFVYDLWGDTVNVAARMESHGVVGQIQTTEATLALLDGDYELTERGEIEIKGRGVMRAYLISKPSFAPA